MQKIIFFTPIPETGALATIITDKSVKELMDDDVIPKNSKYIIQNYLPDDLDQRLSAAYVQYMKFDNNVNPENVVLNADMFAMAILEDVRTIRADKLEELDMLQFRASMKGDTELVDEIEQVKIELRNLPSTLNLSNKNRINDFSDININSALINYKEKYEQRLKG
jgi:hypothetical protein